VKLALLVLAVTLLVTELAEVSLSPQACGYERRLPEEQD